MNKKLLYILTLISVLSSKLKVWFTGQQHWHYLGVRNADSHARLTESAAHFNKLPPVMPMYVNGEEALFRIKKLKK